ncbi:unnamed protein product [Caenorhabditis brenneri]
MLQPWFFLCTVVPLTVGYGYSNRDYGSKEECRKLKHFDIADSDHLNRRAKFSHLERHGKHYTMITCPKDSFMYSLVAEHDGSVFNIIGSKFQDTVVLAAGYNVGVVAKCDGKRTTVETTDGKKIKIKRVACIQYTSNGNGTETSSSTSSSTTTSTTIPMSCTTCDTNNISPSDWNNGAYVFYEDLITTPGECKKALATCAAIGQLCTNAVMTVFAPAMQHRLYSTPPELVFSTMITCQTDGTWKIDGEVYGITKINCAGAGNCWAN